eukprot:SAG11_NODE_354_length_10336_cov_3.789391_3_plen_324_part_00
MLLFAEKKFRSVCGSVVCGVPAQCLLALQDDGSSDDSADDPCVVTSTPPRTYGKKRVRVRRQHDCGADAADDDHLSQQGKKLQRRARKPEHFTAGGHRVAPRVAKAAPAVARMSCNGRAAQLQQERVLQSQRENVIVDCGSDAVSRCGSGSGSTAGAEESSGFGTCADDEYDAIFASIPTSVFSAPCAATLVDVAPAQPGALPPYGGKRAASKPDSCQVAIGASASARAAHSRWGSIGAVEASPTVVQHSGMAHRLAQRSDVTGSSSGGESMCAARASAAGRWGKFGTAAAEVFSSDESDDEEEGGFVETGRDASAANLLFGS